MQPFAALVILATVLGGSGREGGVQANEAATAAQIRAVLDRYVKAIEDGDENALRALWAEPDNASYVTPMQRLRSWAEVQGLLGFLKNTFTRRELKPGNVTIHTAGDAAWAVFDWEFSATQADGKPFQSRGWETQVYERTQGGWRIRHVHYSVPAAPPPPGAQAGQ